MQEMKVRLTLTNEALGTLSGNPKIAEEYIASKHPDGLQPDELAQLVKLEELQEKQSTVFPKDDTGCPFVWGYQFKGFLKEACLAMIESDEETAATLKLRRLTLYLHKRTIDKQIFMAERFCVIDMKGGEMGWCERPLRGQTMKGERISLARSETVPEGSTFEFTILVNNKKLVPYIKKWLDYGQFSGFLQWRNSGKGTFTYEIL